jgi:putative glutamine amidotransferase
MPSPTTLFLSHSYKCPGGVPQLFPFWNEPSTNCGAQGFPVGPIPLVFTLFRTSLHFLAQEQDATLLFSCDSALLAKNTGVGVFPQRFFTSHESQVTLHGLPPSRPNATIWCSMIPADTQLSTAPRPRVGIPWRTTQEQREGKRDKLDFYFNAVRKAGAEPREVSLEQSAEQLARQLAELDAFVLPGSPADVNPSRYGSSRHPKTVTLDPNRDATDDAILTHALRSSKPVLAICYGCQILNVHLHGSLIQDIPDVRPDRPLAVPHGTTDLAAGAIGGDQNHNAVLTPGSLLAKLAGSTAAHINSSHHQAIDRPGEKLGVVAYAPDGTIEAVEWTGDSNWVVGVQWHPERMPDDPLAQRLFEDFVAAARAREAVVR